MYRQTLDLHDLCSNNTPSPVFSTTTRSFAGLQDHWWLSGLHRDVELQSVPRERIQDFYVRPVPTHADLTTWDVVCEVQDCALEFIF